MVQRGFREVETWTYARGATSLPHLDRPEPEPEPEPEAKKKFFFTQPPPERLILPVGRIPVLYKEPDVDSYATSLVRAFEVKFLVQNAEPYSPILKWTTAAMTKNKIRNDSKFTKWCKNYCTIRKKLETCELSEISETSKQLEKYGTTKLKNMDWLDMAKSVAPS